MSELTKLNPNLIIKKIDKETINFQITDNEMLMAVVGQFDQNLKDLAKLTNTSVFLGATQLLAKEIKTKLRFSEAIKFLIDKYFLTKLLKRRIYYLL